MIYKSRGSLTLFCASAEYPVTNEEVQLEQ